MSWVCSRCHKPSPTLPGEATLSALYRIGYCVHDKERTTFVLTPDLDTEAGERMKERGMALVETAEAIKSDWVDRADDAIGQLARRGTPFSAEDVAAIAGRPLHPNAMGARISAAAKKGIIVKAGRVKADRPERHRNEMSMWVGATVMAW